MNKCLCHVSNVKPGDKQTSNIDDITVLPLEQHKKIVCKYEVKTQILY